MLTNTFDMNESKKMIRLFAKETNEHKLPLLTRIGTTLSAIKIVLGGTSKKIVNFDVVENSDKSVLLNFKNPKRLEINLSGKYIHIVDRNLRILTHISSKEFNKNPYDTYLKMIDDYVNYYEMLYNEYVVNPSNDTLSKESVKFGEMIKGELVNGVLEGSRYKESSN